MKAFERGVDTSFIALLSETFSDPRRSFSKGERGGKRFNREHGGFLARSLPDFLFRVSFSKNVEGTSPFLRGDSFGRSAWEKKAEPITSKKPIGGRGKIAGRSSFPGGRTCQKKGGIHRKIFFRGEKTRSIKVPPSNGNRKKVLGGGRKGI